MMMKKNRVITSVVITAAVLAVMTAVAAQTTMVSAQNCRLTANGQGTICKNPINSVAAGLVNKAFGHGPTTTKNGGELWTTGSGSHHHTTRHHMG